MERRRPRGIERNPDQRLQKAALVVSTELARQFSQLEPNMQGIYFKIDLSHCLINVHELVDFMYEKDLENLVKKQEACARVEVLDVYPIPPEQNGPIEITFSVITGDEIVGRLPVN